MSNKNDHDIYIIPPNFIESGTFFGGMFRARNVIEAGILTFAIGVPVFMFVPFGLTTRIIILCLTALPAALVALIGISGESLSEFLIIFLKYLRNRRIVGGDGQQSNEQAPPMKRPGRHLKQRAPKEKESRPPKRRRSGESDFPAEFDEVRSYEIREKLRPKKKPKKELSSKKAKKKPNKRKEKACPPKRPAHIKEQPPACLNPVADYAAKGRESEIDHIPAAEFAAPKSIDFTHGSYLCIDGLYYAYLLIPSDGYKTQVSAGWLSLIVNAGDGIDMDMFLSRQPKERIIQRVGQQLRINRSKIKDVSDTNTDFDDIDGAIRSGYFLKEGLSNNEDFYYLNLLITVTAPTEEDLEWKVSEMKKLLLSQDMDVRSCHFREEQAFLSALPLVSMEKGLFERGKRNLLTGGAASCYPFTSFEMCDDNGILLGVNKYNSSLIIVDIFNSAIYKNANISILGTSGAGKTFTMQLMALRMRRKNIPIFIVAPLKGHEFHRACANVGGEFIQISPASPHCINVMEIRKVDRSVNELLDGPGIQLSELAAKIQQLHIFFSLLIPDMSHEERQLLDEALIRTYNAKGITHDNASLDDPANPGQYREMPVLGDLHEILKAAPETTRMAHILNRLVHGSANTFNKQTNVSLDNKYTVLDISSLTGDLLTVGMFVALDFVWDRAKADRTEEKTIFIDECWQLLSGAGATGTRLAGDFLLEIAKTIRGYGGSAVFASQDLNDFFNLDEGRFGKGIINNSKTKIILNLEDDEAERVQETLHLSDAETMEVTHFERGNGLISTNNNNVMVEFKASPLEKDLITTDRRELREILERKRREQESA